MVRWSAYVALGALVLIGLFVVSLSLWTRHELYALQVTGDCVRASDLLRFRNGPYRTRTAIAAMIITGGKAQPADQAESFTQRMELRAVRRFGFVFISRDEQIAFIERLPACPASADDPAVD